jgi:hypothetical protein
MIDGNGINNQPLRKNNLMDMNSETSDKAGDNSNTNKERELRLS